MRRLQSGPEFLRVHKHVVIDFEYKLGFGTTGSHPFEKKGRLQSEIEIGVVEILQDDVVIILCLSGDRFLQRRETLRVLSSSLHFITCTAESGSRPNMNTSFTPGYSRNFRPQVFLENETSGYSLSVCLLTVWLPGPESSSERRRPR